MKGYLLDTHAALWRWTSLRDLGQAARSAIETAHAPIWVSTAVAFEVALKWRLGKLPQLGDPRVSYGPLMMKNGFSELGVTTAHAMLAGTLEGSHGDPFDRLIAAQAIIEDLVVVTRDREIAAFGCETIWS